METTGFRLFDYAESQARKREGITRAIENNATNIIKARDLAIEICREKGTVNADDVMRRWVADGGGVHDFGNSMGGLFRDRRFEPVPGGYVQSERIHAKGNILKIWRLK